MSGAKLKRATFAKHLVVNVLSLQDLYLVDVEVYIVHSFCFSYLVPISNVTQSCSITNAEAVPKDERQTNSCRDFEPP